MILGYEQPVDIPVMSMYDTDMMKTYLGALKADYEQGVKDEKEFMDKYGDFISPIAGATNAYYNASIGLLTNAYDNIRAQGYDPIRSVAGRNMLRLAMRNVDRSALATMKQSAENAKEYKKAFNELTPEQQEYERWRMKQAGMDIDNWNNNRLWTETGVLKYTGPTDYWRDLTDKMPQTMHDIKDKSGNIIGQWKGVDKDLASKYVDTMFDPWSNSQQGQYAIQQLAKKYIDSGIDSKLAYEQAKSDIKNTAINNAIKEGSRELDPIAKFEYEKQQDALDNQLKWFQAKTARMNAVASAQAKAEAAQAKQYKNIGKDLFKYLDRHRNASGLDASSAQHKKYRIGGTNFKYDYDNGVYITKAKNLNENIVTSGTHKIKVNNLNNPEQDVAIQETGSYMKRGNKYYAQVVVMQPQGDGLVPWGGYDQDNAVWIRIQDTGVDKTTK